MKKIIITITLLTMATMSMAQYYRSVFYESVGRFISGEKLSEITILRCEVDNDTVWTEVSEDTKQRIQIYDFSGKGILLNLTELDEGAYRIICKDPIQVWTVDGSSNEVSHLNVIVIDYGRGYGACHTVETYLEETLHLKRKL